MDRANPGEASGKSSREDAKVQLLLRAYEIIGDMFQKYVKNEELYGDEGNWLKKSLEELENEAKLEDDQALVEKVTECVKALENFPKHLEDVILEKEKAVFRENTFQPCYECEETDVKVTKLMCGHYFCKRCVRKKHCSATGDLKPKLFKCPAAECYQPISIKEYKSITGMPVVDGFFKKIKDCLFCTNVNTDYIKFDPCAHALCSDCFKKYGESKTQSEILVIDSKIPSLTEVKYTYKRIPCPMPSCKGSANAEKLLGMYTEAEQELIENAAIRRFEK